MRNEPSDKLRAANYRIQVRSTILGWAKKGKRVANAVQAKGLEFQGVSVSMSLSGQQLAMRSNVSLAQA